jgi:hypothetical protein
MPSSGVDPEQANAKSEIKAASRIVEVRIASVVPALKSHEIARRERSADDPW